MTINFDYVRELTSKYKTPIFLIDSQIAIENYLAFKKYFTNVDTPYYALKSLANEQLSRDLFESVNADFDIASVGELEILEKVGVPSEKIIYTHPYKTKDDIKHMIDRGIYTMVIDDRIELEKFTDFKDKARLLLRVSFASKAALVQLSKKFGCTLDDIDPILAEAKKLGISISGISFHLGSQNLDISSYTDTLEICQKIFEQHPELRILNIGGGFPINYTTDQHFDKAEVFTKINEALTPFKAKDIRVIAEPGRVISGEAGFSISSVIGKSMHNGKIRYYIDDGVYGSYSGKIYDGMSYPIAFYSFKKDFDEKKLKTSVIFGPTCDSIDILYENISMPELEIGDLIVGYNMGSYTIASSSYFNCVRRPVVVNVKNKLIKGGD